jgi:hypothetical protein
MKKKAKKETPKEGKLRLAKAKKLTDMTQTHGKEEKFQPTTLDQIWGDDGTSKYPTQDAQVYVDSLNTMTRVDIQTHATRVGLIPVENREVLQSRLLREFRRHWAGYKRPHTEDSSVEISQEVKGILEEGR